MGEFIAQICINQLLFLINLKVTSVMQISLISFLILFIYFTNSQTVNYRKVTTIPGHTQLITTASFFNDNTRMITGSNDTTVKIWQLTNYTLVHQFNFTDVITNVALHPVDNRIFVLVFDGNIHVYNGTTYILIRTIPFPTGGGAANYLSFDTVNDRFIIGGYQGAGVNPVVHLYNSTTYAHLSQFSTTLPAGDQINTISINQANTQIAVINIGNFAPYKLEIYHLSNSSLISSFTSTGKIRWAIFDNTGNYLCTTSRDLSVNCYQYMANNNSYVNVRSWTVTGFPYCMNFGVTNTLIVSVDSSIVFYNTTGTSTPTVYHNYSDVQPIFVLDSTLDMSILVTGMQTGNVSIWRVVPPTPSPSPSPTPAPTTDQTTVATVNLALIIGLSVGLSVLVFIISLILSCCFCSCCIKFRKSWRITPQQQQPSRHKLKSQFQKQTQYYIIKQNDDKNNKSDKSSDIDYDQLMAQGTIIVIKDQDKKRKYLQKLHKKQNMKDSDIDPSQLQVQGYIIIIRDDDHPIKNKKDKKDKKKKDKDKDSDKSSDMDYDELMAQGSIIIIKDEQSKKRFIKKLQQQNNNKQIYKYQQLMAQGNIIIIKDQIQQKKYIKQLKKQQQIQKTKHDKLLANGDIIIISDKQKKKQYTQDLKKQLSKLNKPINNNDIKQLQIAQQIIIIQGQDDIDQQQLTYQQLMAQGTIIIIKDDDVIKQYNQYLKKQKINNKNKSNNNNNKQQSKRQVRSNKSSQPDYDMIMAQQCIIIIKDQDDKKQYINFMKKRKNVESQKSSNIGYDQLMNNNGVMNIQDYNNNNNGNNNDNNNMKKKNSIKRANSTNNNYTNNNNNNNNNMDAAYRQLMAEKNVVIINQQGQVNINNSNNNNNNSNIIKGQGQLSKFNKTMEMKK